MCGAQISVLAPFFHQPSLWPEMVGNKWPIRTSLVVPPIGAPNFTQCQCRCFSIYCSDFQLDRCSPFSRRPFIINRMIVQFGRSGACTTRSGHTNGVTGRSISLSSSASILVVSGPYHQEVNVSPWHALSLSTCTTMSLLRLFRWISIFVPDITIYTHI